MSKATPGPWLRDGRTVYALMHAGWHRGEERLKNRVTITVQHDRECSEGEAVACARLIAAAPDYHEEAGRILAHHDAESVKANFARCGCEVCAALRPIHARATGAGHE